jgi:hypothetical protein
VYLCRGRNIDVLSVFFNCATKLGVLNISVYFSICFHHPLCIYVSWCVLVYLCRWRNIFFLLVFLIMVLWLLSLISPFVSQFVLIIHYVFMFHGVFLCIYVEGGI